MQNRGISQTAGRARKKQKRESIGNEKNQRASVVSGRGGILGLAEEVPDIGFAFEDGRDRDHNGVAYEVARKEAIPAVSC